MENYIKNELVCLRASEPVGSDRYNELSKAIQWVTEHGDKEEKPAQTVDKFNYAHTRIRWKEDTCNAFEEYDVIIKLNSEMEDDESIFDYCENIDEFEKLKHYDNGKNYVVVGCTFFSKNL